MIFIVATARHFDPNDIVDESVTERGAVGRLFEGKRLTALS